MWVVKVGGGSLMSTKKKKKSPKIAFLAGEIVALEFFVELCKLKYISQLARKFTEGCS